MQTNLAHKPAVTVRPQANTAPSAADLLERVGAKLREWQATTEGLLLISKDAKAIDTDNRIQCVHIMLKDIQARVAAQGGGSVVRRAEVEAVC